tara:strand:+ start:292 stop:993 length:702 start_codon:yes stop_codon:yes gene_type:complete
MNNKTGVIFTFDDKNIDNWYSYKQFFLKNNIKCTFYITRYHTLSVDEILKLKSLQSDGHEIGFHGTNHLDTIQYLKKHSLEDYLKNEIYPDLSLMNKEFGVIKSFSYPFGSRNEIIDRYLFDHFKIIRGTVYSRNKRLFFKKTIKMLDKIFISSDKDNKVVYGVGIDTIYNNSIEEIKEGIYKAKINKKIIIFYAHSISSDKKYQIDFNTFKIINNYIKKLEIKTLTISEIID